MACHLVGAKPLSEPMLAYCQLDPLEQTSAKSESKFIFFIQENAFENVVWKMTAILCRPQCVNTGSDELKLLHMQTLEVMLTQASPIETISLV